VGFFCATDTVCTGAAGEQSRTTWTTHRMTNRRRLDVAKERLDISDRRDVACLVNVFYDRVRADDMLGPIFDDIAHVDWPTHLPLMYDFWESVLFGMATFKGSPLEVHRALAQRTPLTSDRFARWIALFHKTVDDLFAGATADHAKQSASRIALALQQNIAADRGVVLTNAS
jgi:hemoglobin